MKLYELFENLEISASAAAVYTMTEESYTENLTKGHYFLSEDILNYESPEDFYPVLPAEYLDREVQFVSTVQDPYKLLKWGISHDFLENHIDSPSPVFTICIEGYEDDEDFWSGDNEEGCNPELNVSYRDSLDCHWIGYRIDEAKVEKMENLYHKYASIYDVVVKYSLSLVCELGFNNLRNNVLDLSDWDANIDSSMKKSIADCTNEIVSICDSAQEFMQFIRFLGR